MNQTLLSGPSVSAGVAPPVRRPRRRWPLGLLLIALLGLALLAGGLLWVGHLDLAPLSIVVDGDEVLDQWQIADMPPAHRVVMMGVMLLALLAALVVVPVALVVGVVALAALVLVVIGIPLVVVAFIVALLCSPLLLLGWLLWRAFAG